MMLWVRSDRAISHDTSGQGARGVAIDERGIGWRVKLFALNPCDVDVGT
jgi:hypothetical protein